MNGYAKSTGVQFMIALMKAHNIKRVIVSPGSKNVGLVVSLQHDPWFKLYSSVDERSAAYLACGLSAETGEAVALTCTEATASRNYMPGMTEAYYRKLPILAITCNGGREKDGGNRPQSIDRSVIPKDVARKSVYIPILRTEEEKKHYANIINIALLELTRDGGGPVHIDIALGNVKDYSVMELPSINVIRRINPNSTFPDIPNNKIAIYVGEHSRWGQSLTSAVDEFCEKYNAVVLEDFIGNYRGKYGVFFTPVTSQLSACPSCCQIDILIYIGNISSSYPKNLKIKKVWRVNPDGEVRSVHGDVSYVFEMDEMAFFKHYNKISKKRQSNLSYYEEWKKEHDKIIKAFPELPFSNLWVAQQTVPLLPDGASLFLGIENSLRCWNYFCCKESISGYANTGGFGIDGGVSALVGASLANPLKLYFGVTGDLAFFYDMNVLGNRHIGKNVRLMVINNGLGQQFRNPGYAIDVIGDETYDYVAARGHFGNQSRKLLCHYAEDLGYMYLSASTKEEFLENLPIFIQPAVGERSIVFEVFTNTKDEYKALSTVQSINSDVSIKLKSIARKAMSDETADFIKKIMRR